MPASYTHHLIAQETFKAFPSALQKKLNPALALYFFGAQGADFCFFYRFLNPKSKNLGSFLHRKGGYSAFCTLKTLAVRDPRLLAYALGYVTHYAADVTFHPFVYHLSGKSPLQHSRVEGALDIHFRPHFEDTKYVGYFRKKLTAEEEIELFLAYTAIAVKCNFPALRKPAFLRAISLFNAYPSLSFALLQRKNNPLFSAAINEEKHPWAYPADPTFTRSDSAEELFAKAVTFAISLTEEFLLSMKSKTELPPALFGKNYLTGL